MSTSTDTQQLENPTNQNEEAEINESGQVGADASQTELSPDDQNTDQRTAIYQRYDEKRREEAGVGNKDDQVITPPQNPEKKEEEEITVKVNGRERKVQRSKVEAAGGIDAYQKNAAASELLNHARAEERRLKELEAQINSRAQELERLAQVPVEKPKPSVDTDARKALAKQYHDAILDGEIDKANDLLLRLQQEARPATPDASEIARQAAEIARREVESSQREAVMRKFNQDRIAAVARFEAEFPDIAEDEDLRALADLKTAQIYRDNPDWSPEKIIFEAATSVRERVSGKPAATKALSSADEKLDAKRNMNPVKGGSARAIPRPAPKPQTDSQYVESLRKQRGLE